MIVYSRELETDLAEGIQMFGCLDGNRCLDGFPKASPLHPQLGRIALTSELNAAYHQLTAFLEGEIVV